MATPDIPVLIIGGGIVGLSASLFLSHHGIKSILVERHATTSIHPRARGVNRRTMELFREIGVDEAVRAAGEPLAASAGIYKGKSLVEVIESHKRKESTGASRPPGAAYFEYLGPVEGTRGTQDLVEPVLLKAARDQGGDLRFYIECTGFERDADGVTATLRDRSNNAESTIRASYVIAADGAGGAIRGKLGVKSTGAGTLGHLLNILFEADLSELVRGREFSLCRVDRPEVTGLFTSINNQEKWVFHLSYDPKKGEKIDDFTPERCQELLKIAIGMPDLEIKVKSILPWEPTVRVAEQFQHGRVFLAGDAAHQMPPWGGQGATSGIADVHNLAWKLAAVIRGQAHESLLATYDMERLPVGRLVSEESGKVADERGLFSMKITISAIWAVIRNVPRLAGYGYTYNSPAICTEDTTPWLWWMVGLFPTLVQFAGLDGRAGSRVPHLWVSHDGRRVSTLDLLGKKFVILAGADGKEWHEAAANVSTSLGVDIEAYCVGPNGQLVASKGAWESLAGISSRGAVLIRPDGFVAWRAWQYPSDGHHKLDNVLKGILGL